MACLTTLCKEIPPSHVISADPKGSGVIPQASHFQPRSPENDTPGPLDFSPSETMWKMP